METLATANGLGPVTPPAATHEKGVRKRGATFGRLRAWLPGLMALLAIYLFIAAIKLMGHGLKTMATVQEADDALNYLFTFAQHPMAGVSVGILITALVQSSSFTTCFVVGLVAAGQIDLSTAVPIIMGANVGTSITNTTVSLAHLRRRREFQRSLGGALVHDIFNVLNVLVLLPLEWAFGIISRPAHWFANWLEGAAFFTTDPKKFNLVKTAVKPFSQAADWFFQDLLGFSPVTAGALTAIVAILLLFFALIMLVKMLQGLMKDRLSGLFSRTLFRNKWIAFVVGLIVTASVQSSSVTTSLVVPLVGAGVLTLKQVYPYTLGANIGTTVTAIMAGLAAAAIASGAPHAVQMAAASGLAVAFAHLLFNIIGTCIFWPLSWIPMSLSKGYAKLAAKNRLLAAVYIIAIFFIIPGLIILVTNWSKIA
jgi:solute carrier family 34 (sodium-dependent phosphate cotransporter)